MVEHYTNPVLTGLRKNYIHRLKSGTKMSKSVVFKKYCPHNLVEYQNQKQGGIKETSLSKL